MHLHHEFCALQRRANTVSGIAEQCF